MCSPAGMDPLVLGWGSWEHCGHRVVLLGFEVVLSLYALYILEMRLSLGHQGEGDANRGAGGRTFKFRFSHCCCSVM